MAPVAEPAIGAEPPHKGDDWNAFVAEYKANADIQSETLACLPR